MRWLKRGVLVAAIGGALAALVIAWLPKPVAVDVGVVKRGPLVVEVDEDGQTRVHDRYVVTAPISGTMDRLALEVGTEVQRDGVLGAVRPPAPMLLDRRTRDEANARVAAAIARRSLAETAIVRATAARDQAVVDADRTRKLVARDAVPIAERDRAELAEKVAIADLATAEHERNAARADVAAARAALGEGTDGALTAFPIVAPASGRVLKLIRDSAGPVAAGAPLLELGDPHALEVVVDVLSADAAKIVPGMHVELGGWGGDHPLLGRVRQVEPAAFTKISALGVEEQRVNVIVGLDETPATLGDAFRVEARIVLWQGVAATVPASAVFRDRDKWAVYTVAANVARLVHVELGHRGRTAVEITAGLEPDAVVILHPTDRVVDGVHVAPR